MEEYLNRTIKSAFETDSINIRALIYIEYIQTISKTKYEPYIEKFIIDHIRIMNNTILSDDNIFINIKSKWIELFKKINIKKKEHNILFTFNFIRHGESCQNLIHKYINNKDVQKKLMYTYSDPTLTDTGMIDSVILYQKYLSKIKIDMIGCSPALRTIETSYYMTNSNVNVFPYLREIYKNTNETREFLDKYFPLKTLQEQQEYLKETGILKHVNFNYINNEIRYEPGNLDKFIDWFEDNVLLPISKNPLNIFIFAHANLFQNITGIGYENNNGFKLDAIKKDGIVMLDNSISNINFNIKRSDLICPTNRCSEICNAIYDTRR